ncbi:hypothetical protein PV325_002675 [Microctonus aethiopoides]|nr:hypothetical protein PV325_002675 [Microctonus aethiopoides]
MVKFTEDSSLILCYESDVRLIRDRESQQKSGEDFRQKRSDGMFVDDGVGEVYIGDEDCGNDGGSSNSKSSSSSSRERRWCGYKANEGRTEGKKTEGRTSKLCGNLSRLDFRPRAYAGPQPSSSSYRVRSLVASMWPAT